MTRFDKILLAATILLAVILLVSGAQAQASALTTLGQAHRYHPRVFLTPPWSEIYVTDPERRHALDAATTEYQRLLGIYPSLGYEVTILPKVSVPERADFVLHSLAV
jgi:predicted ATPase